MMTESKKVTSCTLFITVITHPLQHVLYVSISNVIYSLSCCFNYSLTSSKESHKLGIRRGSRENILEPRHENCSCCPVSISKLITMPGKFVVR